MSRVHQATGRAGKRLKRQGLVALGALVGAAGLGCGGTDGPLVLTDPCWESPAATGTAADLRCTGLYESWEEKRVAWDVRAFSPGTPLWSDGAQKQRWIYLPPGTTIDATNPDEWVFPVGTKLWKEFSLGGRRIETRFFTKVRDDKWLRAAYVWSADGVTAERRDRGVANFEGTGYSVPSVSDCDKCHEGRRDRVLGFEAVGLAEPTATGVTLETLVRERRLTPEIDVKAALLPSAVPAPTRAALSWLHVNCGTSCHNRSADSTAMSTGLFLRIELAQVARAAAAGGELDPLQTTISVAAKVAKWAGVMRVRPGVPTESLLFRLASSRGAEQMPPLLSHLPDPDGTRVLRDWITSLAPAEQAGAVSPAGSRP